MTQGAGTRRAAHPMAEAFATCLGRYKAMRARDLAGQTIASATARRAFDDLYAATGPTPGERSRQANALRAALMRGLREQEQLWGIWHNDGDPRRARLAHVALRRNLLACESLISG